MRKTISLGLLTAVTLGILVGCGGGTPETPPAAQGVAVGVSPKQAQVAPGGTATFTASVTGSAVTQVTWSVTEASGGTVDAAGLYRAPSTTGTFHVVATSVADPTASATAVVTVVPPTPIDSSGFLSADRATRWEPGMMAAGGIPSRTKVCATVQASTYGNGAQDATSGISSAISACPAGQVVQLSAGVFTINGGNYLLLNKGITLRGAGPGKTILQKTDGAKPGVESTGAKPSPIIIVGPSRWPTDSGSVSANLVGDGVKGAYTVTLSSASGFAAGQVVLLDELSGARWQTDPGGRGQILASPDWRVVWQKHNPGQPTDDPIAFDGTTIGNGSDAASWFSRRDRVTAEWKKIASVSGNTITFTTPIHITYRAAQSAQLTRYPQDSHVFGAGIEDLSVVGGDNGNIRFERAAESWARGVENSVWHDEGFAVNDSFRVEIREFYVHDAAWAQPGGAGYAISLAAGTSEVLVENGISVRANKVMVARCAGAGSVFGYNYVDMGYINTNGGWIEVGLNASHMVGPHHVLFEGNYGFNADSDKTHGNSVYHTFFRNHLRGIRASFTNQLGGAVIDDATQGNGPRRCAGLGFYSYWMSFVGNVLGEPGKMGGWVYETRFGGSSGIWMLGWDDWNPYPVDAKVVETTLRHGNLDYVTNSVTWDPAIADHALPPSLYLTGKPAFFSAGKGYAWPWVDPTATAPVLTLPAKARYDAGTPFVQP
jgi:hypothetical protein